MIGRVIVEIIMQCKQLKCLYANKIYNFFEVPKQNATFLKYQLYYSIILLFLIKLLWGWVESITNWKFKVLLFHELFFPFFTVQIINYIIPNILRWHKIQNFLIKQNAISLRSYGKNAVNFFFVKWQKTFTKSFSSINQYFFITDSSIKVRSKLHFH